MVANSTQIHGANSWLTDTSCFDHMTPDLTNLSLQQQPTSSLETVTVGKIKSSLLLTLIMVSYVIPLIILGLMVYLEFLILHPIYSLFINFACKTMLVVILMLINSPFRIYLRGRSSTKDWVKMVSTLFHHSLLSILLLTLLLKFLNHLRFLVCRLVILLKFCFGIKDLDTQVQSFFILLFIL